MCRRGIGWRRPRLGGRAPTRPLLSGLPAVKIKSVTFLLNLKALLGVLLPLLGQDDHVLPDGGELLLEQLDHSGLLPQILQLLYGFKGKWKPRDVKVKKLKSYPILWSDAPDDCLEPFETRFLQSQ